MHRRPAYAVIVLCLLSGTGRTGLPPAIGADGGSPTGAKRAVDPELQRLEQEGMAAYRRGDFAAAEKAYEAALQKAEALGDQPEIAQVLGGVGPVYAGLGQLDRAFDSFSRALALYEALGNKQAAAGMLNSLSVVADGMGQFPRAIDYASRGLALAEAVGSKGEMARALNNLGNAYDH